MKTRHPNPIQAKRDLGYGNQIPAGTTKQQPITHHKPDVNIFSLSAIKKSGGDVTKRRDTRL